MGRFSSGYLNLVSLIILLIITENNSEPNEELDISANKLAKAKYEELLDSIADVNEKKINILKRYTALDQYGIFEDRKEDPLVAFLLSYNDNPETIIDALYKLRYRNGRGKEHWNSSLWHVSRKSTEYINDDFEIDAEMNKFHLYEHQNGEAKIEKLRKTEKEIGKNGEESKRYEKLTEFDGSLLRSSCWRRATKKCKKACKAAIKKVCNEYMCSNKMKKRFKKICKSECKDAMDE